MMLRAVAVALAGFATVAMGLGAQVEAPADEAREAFVAFLVERMEAIDVDDRLSAEQEAGAARVTVYGISERLVGLGVDAVVEMAPRHTAVDVPRSGEALLDAISDYQLCMVPLDAIVQDASPRDGAFEERTTALLMTAAVYLTSNYLRSAYLKAGITDERASAYFQSAEMTELGARVAADPELRSGVLAACGPPLEEIWQESENPGR